MNRMRSLTPNILLHPGGGGAQYPFRFKPFRPRNLWARTPGPRPPKSPANWLAIIIGLVVVALIALAVMAIVTGFFGLIDSRPRDERYVDWATEAGFVIERNAINRSVRTIRGEFEGMKAVIAVPRGNTEYELLRVRYNQFLEVQRAIVDLDVGTNWESWESAGAIVICKPVPQCAELANRLAETAQASGD